MKLPSVLAPGRTRAVRELEHLIERLSGPLMQTDRDEGWTESAQETARRIAIEARGQVINGQPCPATFHFARWLDHCGVGSGALFKRVCEVQAALPKPIAYRLKRLISEATYRLTHRSTRARKKRAPVS